MKLIKAIVCLLLSVCMVLPFAACGGADVTPKGDLNAVVTGSGETDSFTYNIYSDGTVGITKYTGGYTRHTVPSEIDGMQVSRIEEKAYFSAGLVKVTIPDCVIYIGDSAFEQNRELVSVKMSKNCLHIGSSAFYSCVELKKIEIPDCLEYIGSYAFTLTKWIDNHDEDFVIVGQGILIKYLGNDSEVTIPDEVRFLSTAFSAMNGRTYDNIIRFEKVNIGPNLEIIGDCAFNLCAYLKEITIPETVKYIGKRAFADCLSLTTVELPESITRIEDYTFWGCEGFREYTVPDHIEYIGYKAFGKCLNLEKLTLGSGVSYIDFTFIEETDYLTELNISEDNSFYCEEDLCVYNKDMTELFLYYKVKPDTLFVMPDSVVTVHEKALSGSQNLVEIYFSENLETIGLCAFQECRSIEYLHISDKLKLIANSAFVGCSAFTEIYYTGSREQWQEIEVGGNNIAFQNSYVNFDCTGDE